MNIHPGDHVYRWVRCHSCGHYQTLQHHRIVLDVYFDSAIHDWMILTADFAKERRAQYRASSANFLNLPAQGDRRPAARKSLASEWTKVTYNSRNVEKIFIQSGSSTTVASDSPARVLQRVNVLLKSHAKVSNSFRSSCECLCVWCKTGMFKTLQAASFAHIMRRERLDTLKVLAGAAALIAATQFVFWQCIGSDVEASVDVNFPALVAASEVSEMAIKAVLFRGIVIVTKDWEAPAMEKKVDAQSMKPARRRRNRSHRSNCRHLTAKQERKRNETVRVRRKILQPAPIRRLV
ncbi:hypothetical protein MPSEU_000049600 [Mayamaea pseudoterrestris]|nr:hypothetical protein MPSEU_000049600 [Mayamaea pseudoterrestris]